MQYHLRTECEDGTLLHNVVTGELVLLSAEETALLETLPVAYSEKMKELIASHFLVPVDFNEIKSVEQLRKLMQTMSRKKEITGYTILPTTACNARCFYCYESDIPKTSMSAETADQTLAFIAEHRGEQPVSIGWFGGEPTVGEKIIDRICNGLIEREIPYSSSMISNGYLFTPDMAKKAKELWKLTNIQITLDGTEEVYNKTKAYVGIQESAYQRVLNNIELLLEQDIRISVRMNMDRYNADDLQKLIEELAVRFGGKKQFSAYVHELFDDCGYDTVVHANEDRLWLVEKAAELNQLIEEKGISYSKKESLPSIRTNYCMADNDGSVIINPDGSFSKCEHYCAKENVGNLWEGFTDQEALRSWKQRVWFSDCEVCPLVPWCTNLTNCFSCGSCFSVTREEKMKEYRKAMKEAYKTKDDEKEEKNEVI